MLGWVTGTQRILTEVGEHSDQKELHKSFLIQYTNVKYSVQVSQIKAAQLKVSQ